MRREHYQRERKELSSLISQVLSEGADAGWIADDLNFQLVAESILGMIRGVRRHHSKEVTVEEAVRTIVAILLDGCLVNHHEITRDSHPAAGGLYG